MANKEKAEVKIGLYQAEIEEYERQRENIREQIAVWKGAARAYMDSRAVLISIFNTIQKAMDWNKKTKKEREEAAKADQSCVPQFEMTDEQGNVAAQLFRPALELITRKLETARTEPSNWTAQECFVVKQIDRMERLILAEQNKDFAEFAGELPEENEPGE